MLVSGAFVIAGGVYLSAKAFGLLPSQLRAKKKMGEEVQQAMVTARPDKNIANVDVITKDDEATEEKKIIDHYFKVSSGVLGASLITIVVFPAAHILAIPPLIYTLLPMFADAYQGLQERKLKPSLVDSIAVSGALVIGISHHLNPFFFMAGAIGVWMYFFSEKLVLKTKDESIRSLSNLFGEQVSTVWILKDAVEIEIPFADVLIGDVVVVNAGGMIPVDGSIIKGVGAVDQRMLTGESQPVEKGVGEEVYAATTLLTGAIQISVEKAGTEAVAAQIGEIWNHTADYRTTMETRGEQLSNKAVLPTLGTGTLALVTLGPVSAAAILLSNFSDTIQLFAPLSTLNFLHLASERGILIKDGRALEGLKDVDTIIFDKTGTLTLDQPHVIDIYLCGDFDELQLLTYAAASEVKQKHPVAKAILQAAEQRGLDLPAMIEATYEVGYGIKAVIDDHWVTVGSDRFMRAENIAIPDTIQAKLLDNQAQGHSLIMVAIDAQLSGVIVLQPTIRPEAKAMIKHLKERNLSVHIISGDNERPTRALAEELDVDQYTAETLPEDKAGLVEALQRRGKVVCFIGDGINDAIALKQANVSISLSGAASAATDTAQIIMMDGRLNQLDHLFGLSHRYDTNLRHGYRAVLGGSVLCVGGVFMLHFGIFTALSLQAVTLAISIGNAFLPLLNRAETATAITNTADSSGVEQPLKINKDSDRHGSQ